jgi:DNA-directed RNA polymerase
MNPFEQISEYLIDKVSRVNPNNPKANSGAVLLRLYKEYKEDMPRLISVAFQTIQMRFTYDTSDSPAGTAQLTAVSTAIGQRIARVIKREPPGLPWNMHVRLGDLFIEAFFNCGYIDIYYPKTRDTSYIVSATAKWIDLADIPEAMSRISLNHTVLNRPKKLTNIMQEDNEPLIKNWTEEDNPEFLTMIETPWVKSINNLQRTGWRINQRIYDALIENKDMFVSSEPIEDNDAKEMKRRSKNVEWGFITTKAKLLYDHDVFYQYMQADYRGRLYYSESFLNYQGSDLARGMMCFARGKPMTEDGLFWLAVHTASSFNQSYTIDEIPEWCEANYIEYLEEEKLESISVDKFTLEDRVRWTNHNMEILIEMGRESIVTEIAEKPVSFLACCFEWYDYQKAVKDNRIHVSHLPVPIDGSNNGWQHLGAISKDSQTGKLVGLIPVDIQHDFYVQTAKQLYLLVTDERLKGILDQMPMKHIRKAISKRGSMTRAYSAGAKKIAENMYFDCKAEDFHIIYGITQADCDKLAKLLIKAINMVCPGPLHTMAYFQALAQYEIGEYKKFTPDGNPAGPEHKELVKVQKALYTKKDKTDEEIEELNRLTVELKSYQSRLIHGNGKDKLEWVTPSGFKVTYENFNTATRKCRGTISGYKTDSKGHKGVNHVARVPTKTPDIRGFMCGVSPNYIHSQDASHMALVIEEWNGDFGAVHDSFSTHACDVETLLARTKQTFIDMYDKENYYDLIQDNIISDATNLDVEQPQLGNLDVTQTYESDYFFA